MELQDQIMNAARQGDSVLLEHLYRTLPSLNFEHFGSTPLCAAISSGQEQIVKLLLAFGADANYQPQSSATPLIRAISTHDNEIANLLLQAKADPNGHVKGYDTPLVRAISYGYDDIVELLLNFDADANYSFIRDSVDPICVPLIVAVKRMLIFTSEHSMNYRNQAFATIKLLLEHNANPQVKGNWRESQYGIQLREKKPSQEEVKSDVDFQEIPLSLACAAGDKELVYLLMNYGALIEGAGGLSEIPLHMAIEGLQPQMVRELIALKAFINSQDFYGQSAVHKAAYNAVSDKLSFDCLKILVDDGADCNIQNYEGDTPLMYLFSYYSKSWNHSALMNVMNLLRASGASLDITNVDGKNGHELATKAGFRL